MIQETNEKNSDLKVVKTKAEYDSVGKDKKQESQEPVLSISDCKLPPIHLICVDDAESSPNYKYIGINNNIAQATNGHLLASIDLTLCGNLTPDQVKILNGKHIHMQVWKEMCGADIVYLDDSQIVITYNGVNAIYEYSTPVGEFFKMNQLIRQIKDAGQESKRLVCYSTKYISLLSKVLESDNLHFGFFKEGNGTIVFSRYDSGSFGVIMPILTEEKNIYYFT